MFFINFLSFFFDGFKFSVSSKRKKALHMGNADINFLYQLLLGKITSPIISFSLLFSS